MEEDKMITMKTKAYYSFHPDRFSTLKIIIQKLNKILTPEIESIIEIQDQQDVSLQKPRLWLIQIKRGAKNRRERTSQQVQC